MALPEKKDDYSVLSIILITSGSHWTLFDDPSHHPAAKHTPPSSTTPTLMPTGDFIGEYHFLVVMFEPVFECDLLISLISIMLLILKCLLPSIIGLRVFFFNR